MPVIASAAASRLASRAMRSSNGSSVWSMISTVAPSGAKPIVRRATAATLTRASGLRALELDERHEPVSERGDALAPAEVGQIDDAGAAHDLAAELRDHADRRLCRAAGRHQIVDEQHALAGRHRIAVHLDAVGAVLERVVLSDLVPGQLAALSQRREAGAERERYGAAEDQPARLDAGDLVDALRAERRGEPLDRLAEAARVEQQRGDVAEQDAGL